MIREGRHLKLYSIQPGVFPGRLIEMAMDAEVFVLLSIHHNSSLSKTACFNRQYYLFLNSQYRIFNLQSPLILSSKILRYSFAERRHEKSCAIPSRIILCQRSVFSKVFNARCTACTISAALKRFDRRATPPRPCSPTLPRLKGDSPQHHLNRRLLLTGRPQRRQLIRS